MHIDDNELKVPKLYDDKSYEVCSPIFLNLSFGLKISEKLMLSKIEEESE